MTILMFMFVSTTMTMRIKGLSANVGAARVDKDTSDDGYVSN